MSTIQIATPFNIDISFDVAPFHKRLFAYLIDFALLVVYLFTMIYVFFGTLEIVRDYADIKIVQVFALLLPTLFYSLFCELWLNGQSVGKKLMHIKVISLDGSEATVGQYLTRWFLRFYEWGFIVFLLFWTNGGMAMILLMIGGITTMVVIATTPKNQRLGDLVAGTAVVATRTNLTLDDTIFMHIATEGYQVSFPEVMRLSDRDINTIKNVLEVAKKTDKFDMCNRVAMKVQAVLKIQSGLYAHEFLEKILEDYNYLSTKE